MGPISPITSKVWPFLSPPTHRDAALIFILPDDQGEAIIWGGYVPNDPGATDGALAYSIDGQPFGSVVSIPAKRGLQFNQAYFNVTGLDPGPHTLQVVNRGNPSTAPLGLSYIYTKHAPVRTSSNRTAKIVGGAVGGGVGAILLGMVVFFFVRRLKRRRGRPLDKATVSSGFDSDKVTTPDRMNTPSTLVSITTHSSPVSAQRSSWAPPQPYPSLYPSQTAVVPMLPQVQEEVPVYQQPNLDQLNARQSLYLQTMDGKPDPTTEYNPYK